MLQGLGLLDWSWPWPVALFCIRVWGCLTGAGLTLMCLVSTCFIKSDPALPISECRGRECVDPSTTRAMAHQGGCLVALIRRVLKPSCKLMRISGTRTSPVLKMKWLGLHVRWLPLGMWGQEGLWSPRGRNKWGHA
eukprot:1161188-Pelagomonas_calceolata.AAC.14